MNTNKRWILGIGTAVLAVVMVLLAGIPLGWYSSKSAPTMLTFFDLGPDPFGGNFSTGDALDQGRLAEFRTAGDVSGGGDVDGTTRGLYGGSNDLATCDAAGIIEFLAADDAKRRAFADAQGISPDETASFIGGLTSVVLLHDTWVTNNGFADNRAMPFQSVLQAGTAVLVDHQGVPRVRCACGNPLSSPETSQTDLATSDAKWDGYSASDVVKVKGQRELGETIDTVDLRSGTISSQRATGTWVLHDRGFGPILFGMSRAEVRKLLTAPPIRESDSRDSPAYPGDCYSISSGDYSSDWWVNVVFKPADAGVVAIRVRRAGRTDRGVGYGSPIGEIRLRYPDFREVAPFDGVRVSEGFMRLQSPADPRLFYFAAVAETSAATIDWMQVGASPGYEGCPAD